MNANESTPSSGESVPDGSEQTVKTPESLWRCTFCGNLVVRDDRPTACLQCRRGESERQLNETRLFIEIVVQELVDS